MKAGNIHSTSPGFLKLRPDLAGKEDAARMMLKRSAVSNPDGLKALPSLQRKGLIVVEFTAENNGRKRKHQHLFMMDEEAKPVTAGDSSLKLTISKVPIDDWTAFLEKGWGNIEGTRLRHA